MVRGGVVMKAQLTFELPEDREEFDNAINGSKHKDMIDDIWNLIFRPYQKYGYNSPRINELLGFDAEIPTESQRDCLELLHRLEAIYRDITNDA